MKIIDENTKIELRTILEKDLFSIWKIAYNDNQEWMKYDGPYFEDPIYEEQEFVNQIGPKYYLHKDTRLAIIKNSEIVGIVNAHFEDGKLKKWLEFGIVIYDDNLWGQGVGFETLKLFITYLFDEFKDIRRTGFTTWSGNDGMKLGDKLGLKKEAQIREVRYWDNKYWDSIKYGILRDEWTSIEYKIII